MLNLSLIPKDVYSDIFQSLPYGKDKEIASMTALEALDAYLKYNGIIGYTSKIIDVWNALLQAQDAALQPKPEALTATDAIAFIQQARIASAPEGASLAYLHELRLRLFEWIATINERTAAQEIKNQHRRASDEADNDE